MKGININCKNDDWIELILLGLKIIETRNSKSLDPYIGKRVGLIKTGKGIATLMGYATIKNRVDYNDYDSFCRDTDFHFVDPVNEYGRWYEGQVKYGYVLDEVERCEPRHIFTKGIVAREI